MPLLKVGEARTGERLRRLQEGHNQAEMLFLKQVWWPSFYHEGPLLSVGGSG
jgi:hypothetical protein